MSNLVARIIKDIENGNLEVEDISTYLLAFPLGLPHYTYLAEDEVTSVCRQHDFLVCLG
jgi:hypothetical protein